MLDLTQLADAVRSEGGISRRLFLAYCSALAAIPTLSLRAADKPRKTIKFQHDPFDSLGVASGDPSADAVLIWTRLAPKPLQPDGGMPREAVEVRWEVAGDDQMKNVIHKGTVVATPELGHSVHALVENLKPDHWYWYRFRCGGATSPIGRTRTLPAPGVMPRRLRFAFASCQHYEEGYFTAYEHMARDDLDLVFHLGDYIYEGGAHKGRVRLHVGRKKCESLTDYRLRYCQYRSDEHLRRMHARCPWVVTWDDHEVENDYAGSRPASYHKKWDKVKFLEKRAHAYQAYYEMMPLHPRSLPHGRHVQIYRSVSFGRLATFQVLDTRQYRTPQPNGDERAPLNAAALDAKNSQMGTKQRKWLEKALKESSATWSVIAQQVMMALVRHGGGYSMDAWPGYAHERMELMKFIAEQKVANPVVLSGDVHANYVNDLHVDDRKPTTPVVATEFVGTSISSKGNGTSAVNRKLLAENPFVKYHTDQRGYVRCTVTTKEWRSDYQIVEEVTKKGGPVATSASFIVAAGKPGAVKA